MSRFPAYVASGHDTTRVEEFVPSQVAGEVLLVGELAIWDAANDWIERAGANPAAGTILGLCEVKSEEARLITPNGRIPLRQITADTIIAMSSETQYVDATHRLVEYGVTRNATSGHWQVDPAKTTTDARVLVVRGDVGTNTWFVRFLAEFIDDGIDS